MRRIAILVVLATLLLPTSAGAANLTQYPLPPGLDQAHFVAVDSDDSVWTVRSKPGAGPEVLQRFEPKSLTWTSIGPLPFPRALELRATGDGQIVASSCTEMRGEDVLCAPFTGAVTLVEPKSLAVRQYAMPGGMPRMEVGGRIVNGLVPTLGPDGRPLDENLDRQFVRLNLDNGRQARYSAKLPQVTYRRSPAFTTLAHDGTPWLLEDPNSFARFDAASGTFDRRFFGGGTFASTSLPGPCDPKRAVFGADGALYVATYPCPWVKGKKYELYRVNPASGHAQRLFDAGAEAATCDFDSRSNPLPRIISDLAAAPDGSIWLSVTSEVWRYEPRTGKLQRFQVPSPTSEYINSIALDRDGDLWFATLGADSLGRISLRGDGIVADLGSVVRRGVADRVTCRQACRIQTTLETVGGSAAAGHATAAARRSGRVIGRTRGRLTKRASVQMRVRVAKSARRGLLRRRRVRLRVTSRVRQGRKTRVQRHGLVVRKARLRVRGR